MTGFYYRILFFHSHSQVTTPFFEQLDSRRKIFFRNYKIENYNSIKKNPKVIKDEMLGQEIFWRILVMLINEAADALFLNIATNDREFFYYEILIIYLGYSSKDNGSIKKKILVF